MKKNGWIKQGLKIIKVIIVVFVVFFIQVNMEEKVNNKFDSLNYNKSLGFVAMAEKKEEEKPIIEEVKVDKVLKTYTGDLTGYAADCPLCNGTLACKPSYDVYKNNVTTYNDKIFGNIRIVASSKQLSCGSVIKFNAKNISNEPVYAIVLDRGVLGSNIDLLMPTEAAAYQQVGRKKITYEVVRNGW